LLDRPGRDRRDESDQVFVVDATDVGDCEHAGQLVVHRVKQRRVSGELSDDALSRGRQCRHRLVEAGDVELRHAAT
jgi:hypothetical protein